MPFGEVTPTFSWPPTRRLVLLERNLAQLHPMLHPLIPPNVVNLHFQHRVFFRPVNRNQAKMVVHNRAFDAVVVGRGKMPSGGDAARCHVVNRVQILVFQGGNLTVVYIARDEHHPVGAGLFDEVEHSLAFVGEICPSLVAIERNAELAAGADDAQVGGLAEFAFEPLPLRFAE